jgi:tRNA/tmRNA/rRNA uracil-C5-methylase (TrmA/RlmC/RlmD family)
MADLTVGDEVTVDVGPIAHGGHCIARHDGRVLFVRHTLPGERVVARITEGGDGDRFLRADAVAVLTPSPDRVAPPCRFSGPGGCGGCDFQHVSVPAQRDLKAAVVREQFARLARLDVDVTVEPVPGDADGLRWRTRTEFAVDAAGVPGMRPHRSHAILPIDDCLIATDPVASALSSPYAGCSAVDVVAPSVGERVVIELPLGEGELVPTVTERVAAQRLVADFEVSARGFWQVHPGAAATFVDVALDLLGPQAGETVLDLYCGVGVFAAAFARAVGESGRVIAVESDSTAVDRARVNLAAAAGEPVAGVALVRARVDDFFGVLRPKRKGPGQRRPTRTARRHPLAPPRADRVLLDPPRTGAGREVIGAVTALQPQRLVYVACDPAALARDTAYLADGGYELVGLRAFDAFPMTHHVECIALFEPMLEPNLQPLPPA